MSVLGEWEWSEFGAMELHYKRYGEAGGAPLVILHGLLGSSRNWQAAAQGLAEGREVYCLDLRNHGESPWQAPPGYGEMGADVLDWLERTLEQRPGLVGHSMGGKVAMRLACERPERIRKLVVVDIAPRLYPETHDDEFVGMRAVDVEGLKSRGEAELALAPHVRDWGMRKFLLTNLARVEGGAGFRWVVNLDAIEEELRELEKSSLRPGQVYEGETLFVMGGKSPYFAREDVALMRRHFPASAVEVIADSGHNPHFERRERFVEIVRAFAAEGGGGRCW